MGGKRGVGKKDRSGTLYVRGVPTDCKAQFKAFCDLRGVTLTAAIIWLMRDAVINQRNIALYPRRNPNGATPPDAHLH